MNSPQVSKAQIKYLQSLKLKKYRQKYGCFVAEGRKVVEELMRDNVLKIKSLYALESWECPKQLFVDHNDPNLYSLSDKVLKEVSSFSTPDLVVAVFEIPFQILPSYSENWILYLDGISDPGNLGTIIRSCDWFGVQDVVLSPGSVDCYNPKAIQASMGSIGRVNLNYLSFEHLQKLLPPGLPIYLADLMGTDVHSIQIDRPSILVVGSESHGISKEIKKQDVVSISIPKHPDSRADSLNAAMATTALLTLLC